MAPGLCRRPPVQGAGATGKSGRLCAWHPAGALCTGASPVAGRPARVTCTGLSNRVGGGGGKEGLKCPAVLTGTLVGDTPCNRNPGRASSFPQDSTGKKKDGGWRPWGLDSGTPGSHSGCCLVAGGSACPHTPLPPAPEDSPEGHCCAVQRTSRAGGTLALAQVPVLSPGSWWHWGVTPHCSEVAVQTEDRRWHLRPSTEGRGLRGPSGSQCLRGGGEGRASGPRGGQGGWGGQRQGGQRGSCCGGASPDARSPC